MQKLGSKYEKISFLTVFRGLRRIGSGPWIPRAPSPPPGSFSPWPRAGAKRLRLPILRRALNTAKKAIFSHFDPNFGIFKAI